MSNRAAFIMSKNARPVTIQDVAIPSPEAHEVVIRNHAVAVNPVDWKIQDYGVIIDTYPFVLGCDAAGTVHSVGSAVTKFAPGDRVTAHIDGLSTKKLENNAFQHFAKTNQALVAKIPDSVTFAQGSVLPVAVSTAATSLFQADHLGLAPPPKDATPAQPTGQVVVIWGGSSSVGSLAIQLARAAGVSVATTASAHNHGYVKALGAEHVLDQSSASVVDEMVAALKATGKQFAGVLDCITSEDTVRKSGEVAHRLDGKKTVVTSMPPPVSVPEDVDAHVAYALTITGTPLGEIVWGNYVTNALANGSLLPKPDPLVVGKGLDAVQEGLDRQRAGVSAQKVVIELD